MGMERREPVYSLGAGRKRIGLEEVVEERTVLFPQFVRFIDGGETILVVIKHARSYILSRWEHLSRLLQLLINFVQRKFAVEGDVGRLHHLLRLTRLIECWRLAWIGNYFVWGNVGSVAGGIGGIGRGSESCGDDVLGRWNIGVWADVLTWGSWSLIVEAYRSLNWRTGSHNCGPAGYIIVELNLLL